MVDAGTEKGWAERLHELDPQPWRRGTQQEASEGVSRTAVGDFVARRAVCDALLDGCLVVNLQRLLPR